MFSTTRLQQSMVSAFAISSRLIAARPPRFFSCVSSSVSNDCNREINTAAPRSRILSEPISRTKDLDRAITNLLTVQDGATKSLEALTRAFRSKIRRPGGFPFGPFLVRGWLARARTVCASSSHELAALSAFCRHLDSLIFIVALSSLFLFVPQMSRDGC